MQSKSSSIVFGMISILVLLFLLSFMGSPAFLHLFGLSRLNGTIYFISRMLQWLCLLLVWLYAIKVEKQNFLIWGNKKINLSTCLISIVAIFMALFAGMMLIHVVLSVLHIDDKQGGKLLEIIAIFRTNKFLLVFTTLTAGVVEELIFRGYLLPRMEIIFKNPYWAIIISSLLFGLLHFRYGTLFNVAGPIVIGLIFAFYYWKYRNITTLIICHFLWDLIAIIVLLKAH